MGKWTIGIGFLVDDSEPGAGVPGPVMEFWLDYLLQEATSDLEGWLPYWDSLPEHVQRALVLMRYQMGLPRLSGFVKMFTALSVGDYEVAASEALDSKWHRQTPERAESVAAMIAGK